jgi:RsiW-degrading membrane proteinase PrsW (M82 family)
VGTRAIYQHDIAAARFASAGAVAIIVSDSSVERSAVSRSNMLYLVIGAFVVAVAVLSYQLYQDRHPPQGMSINFGPNRVSIQGGGK